MTCDLVDRAGVTCRARALTVHQPWATLLARGVKRIENRSWAPAPNDLAPGDFVILHAGKTFDAEAWSEARRIAVAEGLSVDVLDALAKPLAQIGGIANRKLLAAAMKAAQERAELLVPFGAVVGVARFARVIEASEAGPYGAWFVGPLGWEFTDAIEIEPVPMAGAQGLFRPALDVFATVRSRWNEAVFG